MLAAVFAISLTPLWVASSNGYASPFSVNAVLRFDVAVVFLGWLWISHRSLLQNRQVIALLRSRILGWAILFTIINNFDFALFAWSARFIDISASAALFELWAIFIVLLMYWLDRKERQFRGFTVLTALLLPYGCAGVIFVIASQAGGFREITAGATSGLATGVALALAGAVISAFAAFNFRWSSGVAKEAISSGIPVNGASYHSLNMFAVAFAFAISNAIAAVISLALAMITNETPNPGSLLIMLGGALTQGIGSVLWRKSNLITDSPAINAMAYGIPVLSLLWLWMFSFIAIARPGYLITGAAIIVSANVLTNFEAGIRRRFRPTVPQQPVDPATEAPSNRPAHTLPKPPPEKEQQRP